MTMNGGDFAALQQDFERMAQVAEPAQIQSTLEEAALADVLDKIQTDMPPEREI